MMVLVMGLNQIKSRPFGEGLRSSPPALSGASSVYECLPWFISKDSLPVFLPVTFIKVLFSCLKLLLSSDFYLIRPCKQFRRATSMPE